MENSMACEACSVNFSFFKRKKQCMDCLRYFCSKCVIKRFDEMLSCNSCSMLSRRPLLRSQIEQMRPRDLRQYLLAKKASVKGCVEKEDLIKLLMIFANGISDYSNTENVASSPSNESTEVNYESTCQSHDPLCENNRIEIQEISDTECASDDGPEPLISEEGNVSEISNMQHSVRFMEIPVWSDLVKLSDIKTSAELEYLSVKQLKTLLSTNRVDYKGCIERCELLDRACRLWKDHRLSRGDLERLDENLCKICWDEPIECVILECGHIACCVKCGKQMSECPICKQFVIRVVRFFKA